MAPSAPLVAEEVEGGAQGADEGGNIARVVVDVEAGAARGPRAEHVAVQGLGAVMAGPHRHALLVQEEGQVRGVGPAAAAGRPVRKGHEAAPPAALPGRRGAGLGGGPEAAQAQGGVAQGLPQLEAQRLGVRVYLAGERRKEGSRARGAGGVEVVSATAAVATLALKGLVLFIFSTEKVV